VPLFAQGDTPLQILAARFVAGCLAAIPALAGAGELSAAGGVSLTEDPQGRTWGLDLRYTHDFGGPFIASIGYVNEGHLADHHRDGLELQVGLRNPQPWNGLTFSALAGPYRYFDTEQAESPDGYQNAHGSAMLYTLGVEWQRPNSPVTYGMRVERVASSRNPDNTMILASVGYRFEPDVVASSSIGAPDVSEVTAYSGRTILNSFESELSAAYSLEYRRRFGKALRGSLSWLHEGEEQLVRRDGAIVQAWLEPSLGEGRFSVGAGYGAYLAIDTYNGAPRRNVQMLSMTASWRFARAWLARFTAYRSISNDDRDSDVVLLGVGYRF
jgi:hypothetical protein